MRRTNLHSNMTSGGRSNMRYSSSHLNRLCVRLSVRCERFSYTMYLFLLIDQSVGHIVISLGSSISLQI